jgi:hypothetical protein
MACNPDVLKQVPLFALLDDEETAVLAGQVELKTFAPEPYGSPPWMRITRK